MNIEDNLIEVNRRFIEKGIAPANTEQYLDVIKKMSDRGELKATGNLAEGSLDIKLSHVSPAPSQGVKGE